MGLIYQPHETNSAFCPLPRCLQHVPKLALPRDSGSLSVYSLAKVPLSCVPYVQVGIFTEGAVPRQLHQEPSKGQTAWQNGVWYCVYGWDVCVVI